MASAIPLIGSAVGGIFSGIGASKGSKSTSEYNQSGEQMANLDPKQRKMMKAIFGSLLPIIQGGPQVSQAERNTARAGINQGYDQAGNAIEANLAARGFSGGKLGSGIRSTEIDRQKTQQGAEAGLQQNAWQRFMSALGAAFQFNQPRDFTSTSSGTSTQTGSGQSPWSTVGAGIGDLSSLAYMRNLGGGGGGSSSSAGAWNPSMSFCWIASACFGANDWRTVMVRATLIGRARESWRWLIVVMAYRLVGRPVSFAVRHCQKLRKLFTFLFNGLLAEAMNGA